MKIVHLFFHSNKTASGYLRGVTPYSFMEQFGVQSVFYDIDNITDLTIAELGGADIIVIYRELPGILFELIHDLARRRNIKLIYETDDYILEPPEWLSCYDYFVDYNHTLRHMLPRFDGVVVSTRPLRDRLSGFNDNLYVYHNLIPLSLVRKPFQSGDALSVGYSGGIDHHRSIEILYAVWHMLSQKYGDRLQFKLIGPIRPRKVPDIPIQFVDGIMNYPEYLKLLAQHPLDIAYSPLLDCPFNLCKSCIKYLEYTLYDTVGIYRDYPPYQTIDAGKIITVPSMNVLDWYEKSVQVIDTIRRLKSESAMHREHVLKHHTLPSRMDRIRDYCDWLQALTRKGSETNPISLKEDDTIFIWGTGKFGRYICHMLRLFGFHNLIFIDNHPVNQGTVLMDKPVWPPDILRQHEFNRIIIASYSYYKAIRDQITGSVFPGSLRILI